MWTEHKCPKVLLCLTTSGISWIPFREGVESNGRRKACVRKYTNSIKWYKERHSTTLAMYPGTEMYRNCLIMCLVRESQVIPQGQSFEANQRLKTMFSSKAAWFYGES